MGKNHRHKKKLKAEKGKTKLKATKTKFLPKGENVTDTNFKVKPIILQNQLIWHPSSSSKNANVKDILSRLNHHNVLVKLNNLQYLREYIGTVDEDVLAKHVLEIFEVICPLFTAIDRKVRREAARLTDDLIAAIGEDGAEPHFDRLVSHLCCAMTHLSEAVRENSLLVFDVVSTQLPELLATRCDRLVRNFVLLISATKANADDKSMLRMNVGEKRTSVQWRLMVLQRFATILKVVLDQKSEHDNKSLDTSEMVEVTSAVTYVPIHHNPYLNAVDVYGQDVIVDDWLDVCIKDILPLLKDVWIEVQPKNRYTTKSANLYCTVLNEEAANVLCCILSIVRRFYELMVVKCKEDGESGIENKAFVNASRGIVGSLFRSFPYARETDHRDTKCLEENLTLCYLFFVFFEGIYQKGLVIQTLSYLNVCLLNRNYVTREASVVLLKVLRQFFRKNLTRWEKYRTTDLTQFIKNTAKYYVNETKQVDGIEIFVFLCEQIDLIPEHFSAVAQKACGSLVRDRIDRNTYRAIRSLVLQEVAEIQDALSLLLPDILDNLKMVELESVTHKRLKVDAVLSLYRFVPLSRVNVECLLQFAEANKESQQTVQSVIRSSVELYER